jgi:hypothetical protein
MPLPALLIPILYTAGFGAIIEGLISAITAEGGATPEAIAQAKEGFLNAGLPDEVAQRMAEDAAAEVTGGDRAQAAIGGAIRGGLTGAAGAGAIMGAAKIGGKAIGAAKSFLGKKGVDAPTAAAVPTPSFPAASAKPTGPSMPMGDAEAIAAQKVGRPAEMRDEILGTMEKNPIDYAKRNRMATRDDGLQGMVDDVMPKDSLDADAEIIRKTLAKFNQAGRAKPPAIEQDRRDAVALVDYFSKPGRNRPPSFLSRVGD